MEDDDEQEEEEEQEQEEIVEPEEECAEMMVDYGNLSSNQTQSHEKPPLEKLREFISEEEEETLFPPLDGTAFYLLTCKINHSCDPNIRIHYKSDSEKGLVLEMKAVKEIIKNEEFFQSYINQYNTKSDRQKALQDYGFICQCSKCANET
jgi:hypothetical protein